MKIRTICLITFLYSISLFGQGFQVKIFVDDFTGDTIKSTKKWNRVDNNGLMTYFKVKGKKVNGETLLGFAIGITTSYFEIERGNNILFKMDNDEIVPLMIHESETSKVGSAYGTEIIIYNIIDSKTIKKLTSDNNIKAIRVIYDDGVKNFNVPDDKGDIIKKVLFAIE